MSAFSTLFSYYSRRQGTLPHFDTHLNPIARSETEKDDVKAAEKDQVTADKSATANAVTSESKAKQEERTNMEEDAETRTATESKSTESSVEMQRQEEVEHQDQVQDELPASQITEDVGDVGASDGSQPVPTNEQGIVNNNHNVVA